jgi:predicted  nucleic acid-binding Zn-ribbon protein
VSPLISSLIALQALDSAADAARKQLAQLPAAEQAIALALGTAKTSVDAVKARIQENQGARRALEKDIATVDTRLARFDDHKAAVKTNHEYTALLHEISIAKSEKDAIEERLLVLMEEGDTLTAALKTAEAEFKAEEAKANDARAALASDRTRLDAELARLAGERPAAAAGADARSLALYEQLLKGRRGVAVARMDGELCTACHVRLRPHMTQQVRRNDAIVQCDSCQRILYFVAPGEKGPGVTT